MLLGANLQMKNVVPPPAAEKELERETGSAVLMRCREE
jgi:hypothetical protein